MAGRRDCGNRRGLYRTADGGGSASAGRQVESATLAPAAALAAAALGLMAYAAIAVFRSRDSGLAQPAAAVDIASNSLVDTHLPAGIDGRSPESKISSRGPISKVLRASHTRAMAELEKSRRGAEELLEQIGLTATAEEIERETSRLDERLETLESAGSQTRRLEAELEVVQTRRDEIRSNAAQRMQRLRELWPDSVLGDFPDAQELDGFQETIDAAGAAADPVAVSRRMTEISARIASLDALLKSARPNTTRR